MEKTPKLDELIDMLKPFLEFTQKNCSQIRLVDKPQKTVNLFESIEALQGKWLGVLEQNRDGDCLCVVEGRYLIDVKACDIAEWRP